MKYIIMSAALIVGCNASNPCDDPKYDMSVGTLCIQSFGFPVNLTELDETLRITENAYNSRYEEELGAADLYKIIEENDVTLIFDRWIGPRIRGITVEGHEDPENQEWVDPFVVVLGYNCWLRNYVLGHEFLHILSSLHLGVSHEVNASHQVENIFYRWTFANELPKWYAAEDVIANAVLPMCEDQMALE